MHLSFVAWTAFVRAQHYNAGTTDNLVHRSAWSAEARATTRTVVPYYSVIDLTEALIASLTGPSANILTNGGLHHFDSRRAALLDTNHVASVVGTNVAAPILTVARFKEQWPQVQLDFDPVLLSPKSILPRLGYLTGPGGAGVTVSDATAQMFDPDDPDRPVKAFLQEYQTLFGFGPEAVTNASVQRDYVSAGNGARTVVWQQQVAGVPVFNPLLIGHIAQAGELACLPSEFISSPALILGRTSNRRDAGIVLAGVIILDRNSQACFDKGMETERVIKTNCAQCRARPFVLLTL